MEHNLLDLTIVIPSYNTREFLHQCLTSIYAYTSGISFEIICIDDDSQDGSPDMVAREFPDVKLVRNITPKYYAANNNFGMTLSRARYACLLNSDTQINSNAFASLVGFMDEHPDAAACGPKLLNPDGSVQHCIRHFAGLGTMILHGLGAHKLFPNGRVARRYFVVQFDYSRPQAVDSIGTTSFVVRRSTWESVGMLDERFPHFQVDLAYNLMLKRKGLRVYYTPTGEVIHYGGRSINQQPKEKIRELHSALIRFNDTYDYFGKSRLSKTLVKFAVKCRCVIKLIEYHVSRDKRVIKSPGAPRHDKHTQIRQQSSSLEGMN